MGAAGKTGSAAAVYPYIQDKELHQGEGEGRMRNGAVNLNYQGERQHAIPFKDHQRGDHFGAY